MGTFAFEIAEKGPSRLPRRNHADHVGVFERLVECDGFAGTAWRGARESAVNRRPSARKRIRREGDLIHRIGVLEREKKASFDQRRSGDGSDGRQAERHIGGQRGKLRLWRGIDGRFVLNVICWRT